MFVRTRTWLIGALALMLVLVVLAWPRHASAPSSSWSQGYEAPQGSYMQPDHGIFYYWFLYHVLFENVQPTYHTYVVPYGYPRTYRPWYPAPSATPRKTITSATSTFTGATRLRTNGGFRGSSPSTPRSTSGFFRSSGGFASSPGGFRSSGGFRGGRR